MPRLTILALPAALALGTTLALPTVAHACGGTFCDSGPTAMPVDQTGENIIFVRDGDLLETHIQIQYFGEAEKFAWVVPLMVLPQEFQVGSERLFSNLLSSTVPTYGFATNPCLDPGDSGGTSSSGGGSDSAGDSATAGDTGGGPDVVFEDTVGAFEVVVLEGGTAKEVMDWLADNGYQQDPVAEPILDEYLQEGFLFAAFKLRGGVGVEEIHPVVIRQVGVPPCVPLRLTRIAAEADMDVRIFALGSERAYPETYKHVELNPARIDWLNTAGTYKTTVSRAVDEAGGHAFVTEFAGSTCEITETGIVDSRWDDCPFYSLDPADLVDELVRQDMWAHPLIPGLLAQYFPVPDGVDPSAFYDCPSCYDIDRDAWDGWAFGQAVRERIIEPGIRAHALLRRHDYVTRLYTTISPDEMTLDPTFGYRAGLGDRGPGHAGVRDLSCGDETDLMTLPDGREVAMPTGTWPAIADMPYAERVETITADDVVVDVDNTGTINQLLVDWNAANGHDWDGLSAEVEGTFSGCKTRNELLPTDCEAPPKKPGGSDQDAVGYRGCSGCRADGRGTNALWWLLVGLPLGFSRLGRRGR